MQRFFIDPKYIDGNDVSFPENIEKQIRKVLRLESSDAVVVLDNTGMTYLVELQVKRGQAIKGIIVAKEPGRAEPCVGLRLCFSLSRKEKLEWIFQKCTEIGVTVFQPFISSRSIVQDIDSFESKRERYATIAKEAAEQSMRSVMPVILPVVSYEALVAEKTDGLKIIPWEETATVERMKAETFCFEEGKEPSEIRVLDQKVVLVAKKWIKLKNMAIIKFRWGIQYCGWKRLALWRPLSFAISVRPAKL